MSRLILFLGLTGLSLLSLTAAPPVTRSLIVELDAKAQPALRQQASLPPLADGRPLERWINSVPSAPSAIQVTPAARPQIRMDEAEAFVRFDGKEDFLSLTGLRRLSAQATVFVLASPHSNPGLFSAMFSTAVAGQNDYTSGLNLDFGPAATDQLSVLNLETAGAPGFRDWLQPGHNLAANLPFGGFHVFTVRTQIGEKGNELFLDGVLLGQGRRLESTIGLDEMVIGGRLLSHDAGEPPYPQSFFHGDIAAVLVYDRALTDEEREAVEQALFARTPALNALAAGRAGHALEVLRDPPPVQMLAPGFSVRKLPVQLTNINNLRYRHDGVLVALGYDGRVHLLRDTDGDGLEDQATVFWDQSPPLRVPLGIALLPKNDPRGDGVFVASKGKVSLLLDKDRDGRAEEEIIVAQGWKEIFAGVDATGIAIDPQTGWLYYGMGVENFADAYMVDPATGQARYRLEKDHGTIQRVSPDFKIRETVCTGIRFACGLAFNRHGDLFATEQEGATWLPNGNPFDELLHIQPGKHYGFPPRHPKHLPQVIDEPAVMEYGPQHQSTVGLIFNEGVNGGPAFGPPSWHGDALVCGEARGKLYRTKLIKTPHGYVAQNHLIACLSMLTVDCCVTPRGDLLIACHSGPPDWGTGPTGPGTIFHVRYEKPEVPQPIHAWAAAPDEFRIAFDRSLNPNDWVGAAEKIKIEAGAYVRAGDRYEVIRPGYQVVRDQMAVPRRWVEVQSLSLTPDQRTLVLRVPRQTEAVHYAITLPVPTSWQTASPIEQRAEMDVDLTLEGVLAEVTTGASSAKTVLPHPALEVSQAFTTGSADHEVFFQSLTQPGATLTLRGQVNVSNLFVPDIQPGSVLDYSLEKDAFAQQRMTLEPAALVKEDTNEPPPFEKPSDIFGRFVSYSVTLPASRTAEANQLAFSLGQEKRPLPLRRLRLPWGQKSGATAADASLARTDVKGNWLRGRRLFFGAATCSTCHTLRGEGVAFGPDLTNLVHRDRESVLHDILQPSATINPDQAGTTLTLTDGTQLNGLVRELTDTKVVLALPGGAVIEKPRADIAKMEPMRGSLMPEGLGQQLSREQLEDLLTFLLTEPLQPAPIVRVDPPAPGPRSLKEIAAFLPPPGTAPTATPPLRILLSADEKDHGVGEHDYPLWLERWTKLLSLAENVTVTPVMGFPTREQFADADVAVFYSRSEGWNLEAARVLDEFQQRGGGLVYLHWAVRGREFDTALAERIGLASNVIKYRHGVLDLVFSDTPHPIIEGFTRLRLTDESYWKLTGDPSRLGILATSHEDNAPQPQLWVFERGNSRVFGCIPGHYTWTFDDPLYRLLVLRGLAWAAQQDDINRFAELSLIGARIAP